MHSQSAVSAVADASASEREGSQLWQLEVNDTITCDSETYLILSERQVATSLAGLHIPAQPMGDHLQHSVKDFIRALSLARPHIIVFCMFVIELADSPSDYVLPSGLGHCCVITKAEPPGIDEFECGSRAIAEHGGLHHKQKDYAFSARPRIKRVWVPRRPVRALRA